MKLIILIVGLQLCNCFQNFHSLRNSVSSGFQLKMAEISLTLVKQLREKAGAGMMDCKKALEASNGDMEGAVDWLRKKGLASVAKKSGRVTSSGLVAVKQSENKKAAAVLEMNSETDFVARNDIFVNSVTQFCSIAADNDCDLEKLKALPFQGESSTVGEEVTRLVAVIGENMNLRRVARLTVENGQVFTYMHSAMKPGLGKIGVAVAVETTATNEEKLNELGKKLTLHIAAQAPDAVSIDKVLPENLEREKNVLLEQAKASGKPEAALEKMVEGRIRKYYEEVVLLEQGFVMEPKLKISQLLQNYSNELGAPVQVTGFIRFALGDGIAKKED